MAAVKCLPTGAKVVTCEFLRRICEEEERRTELNYLRASERQNLMSKKE